MMNDMPKGSSTLQSISCESNTSQEYDSVFLHPESAEESSMSDSAIIQVKADLFEKAVQCVEKLEKDLAKEKEERADLERKIREQIIKEYADFKSSMNCAETTCTQNSDIETFKLWLSAIFSELQKTNILLLESQNTSSNLEIELNILKASNDTLSQRISVLECQVKDLQEKLSAARNDLSVPKEQIQNKSFNICELETVNNQPEEENERKETSSHKTASEESCQPKKDLAKAEKMRHGLKTVTKPLKMSFQECLEFEALYEDFVKYVNIEGSEKECQFTSYDKSVMEKLNLGMTNTAKNSPAQITALDWYPSPDCLVLAAGTKYGNLEIMDVNSEYGPYVFKCHTAIISNLGFNPLNRVQLVSSSYDGTLCLCDMAKHTFDKIYNVAEKLTYFDYLSQSTYLVSQMDGNVALVDSRTEGKQCANKMKCHENTIKSVNGHPKNKDFFVTAECTGSIRIWDLRNQEKGPVADITHHKKSVVSAFFSPVTGHSILATSAANYVSIFDTKRLTENIKLKKEMRHNNATKQPLSSCRATWLPNSEKAFSLGNVRKPQVQIFNPDFDVLYIVMHKNLTTVCSTITFHPNRPALAVGNSNSKVYIFTGINDQQ